MIENRLIEIFLELVKIDGVSGKERKVADYITSFLSNLNLNPREDRSNKISNGDAGNIICKFGTGGDFVLLSHMDTVRSTKDLKPVLHKDRISSDEKTILGSDNRAGVAVILFTIEKAIKEKTSIKDFTIAFTNSEETTLNGSRNLHFGPEIQHGFVFDLSLRPGNFICNTPGAVSYKITIYGKASHSGIAPEKGISSIIIAANAISKLPSGRIDEDTTANIGIINGGSATNIVPEKTVIDGEVRSFVEDKVQKNIFKIQSEFEEAAKNAGGKIEFEYHWDFKPYKILPESNTYKEIYNAIKKTGLEPNPTVTFGGSDANSLNELGISAVDIGIGAQNPHSNEEFILLEDLYKSADIALELIKIV